MSLILNTAHSFQEKAGSHGLEPHEFEEIKPRLINAINSIKERREAGELGYLDLPFDWETYDCCAQAAEAFAGSENLLIAGIGGSALGPQAMFNALCHPLHNLLSEEARKERARLFILDNVDPDLAKAQLDFCDPETTCYNIISKSGATAETAAATLLIFDKLKKALGADWKSRVICTTDPKSGDLRALCTREGLMTLDLPSKVGGRFSVLSAVGLFPAFCLGMDVDGLLNGAAEMAERCLSDKIDENPAAQMAGLLYSFDMKKYKPMHVMMAYANSLYSLADWFRQMWAESLGKARDLDENRVNTGPTPIKALGTTDQHSQVQLYIEGPQDKAFIFLEAQNFRNEVVLPALYPDVSSLSYLGNQTMNKLMASEFAATREALAEQERPSMTISFPQIDAHAIGEFFMLLEVATTICGDLYYINPFDQPGVELGKVLTYKLMGREGY